MRARSYMAQWSTWFQGLKDRIYIRPGQSAFAILPRNGAPLLVPDRQARILLPTEYAAVEAAKAALRSTARAGDQQAEVTAMQQFEHASSALMQAMQIRADEIVRVTRRQQRVRWIIIGGGLLTLSITSILRRRTSR